MANLLTAFKFSPIKDAGGVEQMPKGEFFDAFVGYVFPVFAKWFLSDMT